MDLLTRTVSPSLLNKTKGIIDPSKLIELQQKENAALMMCGGLLGNCYLLTEIVESSMIDAISAFKHTSWYKHKIKQYINKALKETHKTINSSTTNSYTNAEYMREMADAILDILKPDLFKLKNAILLELQKRKIVLANAFADMITIDILLKCINIEYDETIEYMQTIFKTYYDSWYHPAKCESASYWWNLGMQEFAKVYLSEELNLSNIDTIKNGINVILKKMHSSEVSNLAKEEVSKYAEEGGGYTAYSNALKTLGLTK